MIGTDHVGTAALGCPTWFGTQKAKDVRPRLSKVKIPYTLVIVKLIGVLRLRNTIRERIGLLRSG